MECKSIFAQFTKVAEGVNELILKKDDFN